jgi:ABC-2 type transport system ATP-binding protein
MNAIECRELRKHFRKIKKNSKVKQSAFKRWFNPVRETVKAIDDVSFEVKMGEIFGILGPNGSGKSTLIRVLSTLLFPDQGNATIHGHDVVKDAAKVQRLINRVSVDAAFFKKLSAYENLLYSARLYGVPMGTMKDEAMEILKKLDFDPERFFDPLEDFSRGMQQKVAIARALLTQPMVILLDEPTTGLDPKSKRDVQAFIREINDKHNATVILTTHDMDEADKLCGRIAIIDGGKFIELDTAANLKAKVADKHENPTLEDVFLDLTGKKLIKEDEVAP